MNSNKIQERQNEEKSLKVQYAARTCFNCAEKYNHWAWVACLVSAFSIFLPSSWSMYITNGIPFIADIAAVIFSGVTFHKVKWASKLRKYFDSYVLGTNLNQFSETVLREIREETEKIYLRNQSDAAVQMPNTGKDSPPGVRDWYVFSGFYEGIEAQFECQRQNTWWNEKMFKKRMIMTSVAIVLVGLVFLLLTLNSNMLNIILCSAGIIIKIFERLVENYRYISTSRLIDGAQKIVEVHPTEEGIIQLQSYIDQRRSINVLEIGWLHKKYANKISKIYEILTS